jgi:hypothetical protein
MTDSPDPVEQPSPTPTAAHLSPRIVIACLAALSLFVGSLVILYRTWLPQQDPNTMIIVQGDAHFIGAEVTADPVAQNGPPVVATLTGADDYRVRMHVPAAAYRVTIRFNGRVIVAVETTTGAKPYYVHISPAVSTPTTSPENHRPRD